MGKMTSREWMRDVVDGVDFPVHLSGGVIFRRPRVHEDVDRGNPFFCQPTMPSNMWYTDRKPSRKRGRRAGSIV